MAGIKMELMRKVADPMLINTEKISVIGAGAVGMACAVSILMKYISNEVCLVDIKRDNLIGELMDLQHGSLFLNNPNITATSDFAATANSRICVVTAGVRQKDGETRLSLVQRNADILKDMIPKLVKYSPNTIILMVTNPVDIMSFVAWKVSGLPKNRVFGTGTSLDTARFRVLLSKRLGVAPTSCEGYIIGEHGDSSVPVWSSVNVAGQRLAELNPAIGTDDDPENWLDIHRQVVAAAYEIIKLKGYTNWAIGLCTAHICHAVLTNTSEIIPCSVYVKGDQGIDKEVFLSLPCVINGNGATNIIKQQLNKTEKKLLQQSAKLMAEVQSEIKF